MRCESWCDWRPLAETLVELPHDDDDAPDEDVEPFVPIEELERRERIERRVLYHELEAWKERRRGPMPRERVH